jgi:hypothetical protein
LSIDDPEIEHRLMFWQQKMYNVDGFLYYLVNDWHGGTYPWKALHETDNSYPYNVYGNGILVYSGFEDSEGKYDEYIAFVRKEFPFREKFEVYTSTECKRIKDPKQFEDGLAKVIADYLASQGVKDTSVNVRFMENW